MGSIIGKTMEESMKKNQEFMLATQRMQVCSLSLACDIAHAGMYACDIVYVGM